MGEAVRLFMSGFDTINMSLLTKLGRYTKHMPHRHKLKLNFLFLNPYNMFKNSSYNWQQCGIGIRRYIWVIKLMEYKGFQKSGFR